MRSRRLGRLLGTTSNGLIFGAASMALTGSCLIAQTTAGKLVAPPIVPPGTVTGHVTCSDTNGPARFANVTLQPVVGPKNLPHRDNTGSTGTSEAIHIIQTSLDGSFTISRVPPGNYYVLADAPGYLSPTSVLTREQMDHPTEAQARTMAEMLAPVLVASNRASAAEIRLRRGATIAGTVRFDDGTPYAGGPVTLSRKGEDGKWQGVRTGMIQSGLNTDDLGHFRHSALPAGEYRVGTELALSEIYTDSVLGQAQGWSSNFDYTLSIYSPDTTRSKDSKVVKLTEGQSEENVTIEIPLSKLHAISGSLVEEGSGRRVNGGKITLLYADDNTQLSSTDISAEDEAFHLPFVPEGSYIVKVTDAKEVMRTVTANPPGTFPPMNTETKTIRTYGDASQPLVVTSDVQGVLVSVPAAKPASAPTSAP